MMPRKPLIIRAIALLLVLGTLTLLVPFLHEALFLFAFYLMAMEFETGGALGGVRRPHKSGEMTLATARGFGGMIVSPVEEIAWTSR